MSTATVAQPDDRLLTAEEYAALPDDRKTELVEGRVVALSWPGFRHGEVQANVAYLLADHVETRGLGHVVIGTGIVTRRNPDTVRGADISFFSFQRVPRDRVPEGYPESAPEIVFEVLSPDDRMSEVLRRVAEYLAAGADLACVIDPQRRNVVAYGREAHPVVLSAGDALRLPAPLADWVPRVNDLIPE